MVLTVDLSSLIDATEILVGFFFLRSELFSSTLSDSESIVSVLCFLVCSLLVISLSSSLSSFSSLSSSSSDSSFSSSLSSVSS